MPIVDVVEIIDLKFEPMPMPRHTCAVRAQLKLPLTTCVVDVATAHVRKSGSGTNLDTKTMTRESSTSNWWRSATMSLMGLNSGDTIVAYVDVRVTCVHEEEDVPSLPVPIN